MDKQSEGMSDEVDLRFPEALKNMVLAVEGNIASGKSELGKKLKTEFNTAIEYAMEPVNRAFLALFYGNPAKYGFAFQVRMQMVRQNQLNHAKMHNAYPSPEQMFYWDRSMLGDHMFAALNHLLGSIDSTEMKSYEHDSGSSLACMRELPYLKDIHLFTFLNSEPVDCKRRAEDVRGNKEESGIPLSYYEGIDDMHFYSIVQLIEQNLARVLILHWGEYHSTDQVLPRIEAAVRGDSAQPKIERIPHAPPVQASVRQGTVIYRSASDVAIGYQNLDLLEPSKTVYIPDNIMTVSAASKKMTVSSDFPITFYHNAYKQVVLRHLSHNSRVVFYKL